MHSAPVPTPAGWLLKPQTLALLGLITLLFCWFWVVAAHRIHDAPYSGFASVFVTGCGDFEHFYHGALALREGRDPYSAGARGYIYPPLIAFLFMPLTYLSVQDAALVMLFVNLALGGFCAWLACTEVLRRFGNDLVPEHVLLVVALTLLLSAPKLRIEFQMWQTDVPMMAAILLALRALDSRPWLAGLVLGAAINVKYLPLVYLPYLLLRRRFEAASWSVVGIVVFALLPSLASGWSANLHFWAVALSGLARLVGIAAPAAAAANVDPIAIGHSISITSGFARALGPASAPHNALLLAGMVGAVALGLIWRLYVRAGKPVLRWPGASGQQAQPYLGMVALEWMALMALMLAFSPQTNPRHTSLLLMAFAPLAAMICLPRPGVSRRAAIVAAAVLFLGLVLPPNTPLFAPALAFWRDVGGAGWAMLLMLPWFFVAGLRYLDGPARPQLQGLRYASDLPQ